MDKFFRFFDRLFNYPKAQPIGWQYQYYFTSVLGAAALNTGGVISIPLLPASTVLRFTAPSIITRIDLTVSITGNAAGDPTGAILFKNPMANSCNYLGCIDGILGIMTTKEDVVITKTMNLTPWTGIKLTPNEFVALGWIGNAVALVNISYHVTYLTSPGDIAFT